MTGFGRGTVTRPRGHLVVTIRAVNSRYLDLKIKGAELPPELEMKLRELVTQKLNRGSVLLSTEIKSNGAQQVFQLNKEKYEAVEKVLLEIQRDYGRHLDMGQMLSMSDLLTYSGIDAFSEKDVLEAVNGALNEVARMRKAEGKSLDKDIQEVLNTLKNRLSSIESTMEAINSEILNKHRERIKSLIEDNTVDEGRIEQELAILADKMDIREEVVRCTSHVDQFLTTLDQRDPVGKQLNFLLQEMGREVNTIGSKTSGADIINTVIDMKSDIEKIREQIQNIL